MGPPQSFVKLVSRTRQNMVELEIHDWFYSTSFVNEFLEVSLGDRAMGFITCYFFAVDLDSIGGSMLLAQTSRSQRQCVCRGTHGGKKSPLLLSTIL